MEDRVRELMQEARSLDPSVREAWFADLDDPPDLIASVRRQLAADESATTLEQPTLDAPRQPDVPPGGMLRDPSQIGPYEVIRKLGEGGFGVVFLAHQEEPIRRDVAIKVVRGGFGSSKILLRFEAERQALALMSHPGVAKVIDAGSTESGDSYFVMEYVDGKPLDQVCDESRLTLNERIELMISICEAIQHAHGKGIIHRDIKPGNILVSRDGDRLLPRVIDFGIAKALDPEQIGTSGVTMEGQFIGTPNYMSPEQTGFTGEDVDVRADVYALGAVLYQILVGRQPVTSETIKKAQEEGGLNELQRVLCEQSVPKASIAFQTLCDEEPEIAKVLADYRQSDARTIVRSLHGDLDWILMCALDKDRERRYATPLELASDLRRHLRHEPVLASPPSNIYKLSKFVRRNRAGVTAVASVFIVLVIAFIYSNAKRMQAEHSARETESTLRFVEDSFTELDPSVRGGRNLRAKDFFLAGYNAIAAEELEPRVRARLYALFATVFIGLGDYAEAEASARAGLEVFERSGLMGDGSVNENGLRALLAESLLNQGRQGDAVTVQESMEFDTPELHEARGFSAHNVGDYDAARWHYQESIRMREEAGSSFELAQGLDFLGRLLLDAGEVEEGSALIEQSAMMRKALSTTDGSAVAMSMLSRGYASAAAGDYEGALGHYEDAHALYWELHKPDVTTMVELSRLEVDGVLEDAGSVGVELSSEVPEPTGELGTGFMEAILFRNRARILYRLGATDQAFELLDRSLQLSVSDPGYHIHTLVERARILADFGEFDLALTTLDDALLQLDQDDPFGEACVRALKAELLLEGGIQEEAVRELERLRELRRNYGPRTPPQVSLQRLETRLKSRSRAE